MTDNAVANPFSLEGQRALITGGLTGLGRAMAQQMVQAGAQVILASRHGSEEEAGQISPDAAFYAYDVTHSDDAPALVARIEADHGPIDILVNNAGTHCKKPIQEMTVQDFQGVLDVHLTGAFALTKAVVPGMVQRGHGSILFIASMTSFLGMPDVAGYATAKSGVLGLVRSLAVELGPQGVRVNAIAPGWIDTPMFHQATDADPERQRKILSRTPMNCFGAPTSIGHAAVFLSSPAAAFISGVVLPVDGGAVIGF